VNNERAPAITHSFSQPGTYWVVLRDTAGCSALDSTLIVVTAQPETTFEYTVSTSCSGREVELTYTGNAGAVSWNWVSGSGSGQNLRFQTRTESDSLQITLVATENNCTATRTATIPLVTPAEAIVFPNVITPNGDGINDSWCFEGAASFSDCFEIQIFSRWGQKVFQSTSPETCWDPRDLPTGVYFFTTTVGVETRNGTITVIK
jgi:gliding motility-associated-like protein